MAEIFISTAQLDQLRRGGTVILQDEANRPVRVKVAG